MSIRGLVLFAVAIIAASDDSCDDSLYDCYIYDENPFQCGTSPGMMGDDFLDDDAGMNCCVCQTPHPSA